MNPLYSILLEDGERVCDRVAMESVQGRDLLITGASGLLGVHLLATLHAYARRSRGSFAVTLVMQAAPPAFMSPLMAGTGARILQGDLSDPGFLEALPKADLVIHAAGYGQPGRFLADPAKTLALNTAATSFLLRKLRPGGRFLFLSSSEVYNGLKNSPYRENQIGTTNTDHPRSCYIEGKRCGEAICQAHRLGGVAASCARLALAYGPGTRKDDARVLNTFIQKGLSGKITLLDRGDARRTYCYVSDAVELLWHILLEGSALLYNVGGISHTTILELAECIGRQLGVSVELPEVATVPVGAPDEVRLDLSRVCQEFGKRDFMPLSEGLGRTIAWQKALYGA